MILKLMPKLVFFLEFLMFYGLILKENSNNLLFWHDIVFFHQLLSSIYGKWY